ncbi:hypothetical protein GCM10025879_04250 [Leuconostoc litchii]|nr:hypothetical protein GCM10025879_04250 [Leuconostoc litchii]
MNRKFGKYRQGIKQPALDQFITKAAADTIKRKKPDMTAIHLVDMDAHRHKYGVHSKEAYEALQRLDANLGELIKATKEAGIFDKTNFVVLGDHFQIDVENMIHLNQLFAVNGWLTVNDKGLIDNSWRVLAKTTDGSTYIYINDMSLKNDVYEALKKYRVLKKFIPQRILLSGTLILMQTLWWKHRMAFSLRMK